MANIINKNKSTKNKSDKFIKRRVVFILAILILFFIILRIISSFGTAKKNNKPVFLASPSWSIAQILREENKEFDRSNYNPTDLNELYLSVYDKASGIKKRLKPNDNHTYSAEPYAYDTGLIRAYIRGEKIYKGDKLVFLTFDDGPNNSMSPKILKILAKNNVHATFFVVGKNIVEKTYDVLNQELMQGHSIAIHSFSHDYTNLYPERTGNTEKILEEARLTQGRLKKALGEDFKSKVWRYPGGHQSWKGLSEADEKLKEMGINWIDWNTLSGDAEAKSVRPTTIEDTVKYVTENLHKNLHSDVAVVLMHDTANKKLTADSLQFIIDYFKKNDYKFGVLK